MNYDGNRSQDLIFLPQRKGESGRKIPKPVRKAGALLLLGFIQPAFLNKIHYHEFLDRLGEDGIRRSYGDLTGDHMFERWLQEYELACSWAHRPMCST